jgi:hypothetical protein
LRRNQVHVLAKVVGTGLGNLHRAGGKAGVETADKNDAVRAGADTYRFNGLILDRTADFQSLRTGIRHVGRRGCQGRGGRQRRCWR